MKIPYLYKYKNTFYLRWTFSMDDQLVTKYTLFYPTDFMSFKIIRGWNYSLDTTMAKTTQKIHSIIDVLNNILYEKV